MGFAEEAARASAEQDAEPTIHEQEWAAMARITAPPRSVPDPRGLAPHEGRTEAPGGREGYIPAIRADGDAPASAIGLVLTEGLIQARRSPRPSRSAALAAVSIVARYVDPITEADSDEVQLALATIRSALTDPR